MELTGPQAAALTVLGNAVAPMSKRALLDAHLDMRSVNKLVVLGRAQTNGEEYWLKRDDVKQHGDEVVMMDDCTGDGIRTDCSLDHENDTRPTEDDAAILDLDPSIHLPTVVKPRKATKSTASTPCICGCGEMAVKSFRQGHDARLKGAMHKFASGKDRTVPRYEARTLEYIGAAPWATEAWKKHIGIGG